MNNILEGIGNTKLPSILNDPFQKAKINRVYVSMYQSSFSDGTWYAQGTVEFKNGDTVGKQEFKGESFDDVVFKIKAFLSQIQ